MSEESSRSHLRQTPLIFHDSRDRDPQSPGTVVRLESVSVSECTPTVWSSSLFTVASSRWYFYCRTMCVFTDTGHSPTFWIGVLHCLRWPSHLLFPRRNTSKSYLSSFRSSPVSPVWRGPLYKYPTFCGLGLSILPIVFLYGPRYSTTVHPSPKLPFRSQKLP